MCHIQGKELKFIKGKDHPRKSYEGPEREEVYRCTIILIAALDRAGLDDDDDDDDAGGGGGGRRRKRRRRKRRSRRRRGENEEGHPGGFDPQTVQPTASHYTNYAFLPHLEIYTEILMCTPSHVTKICSNSHIPSCHARPKFQILFSHFHLRQSCEIRARLFPLYTIQSNQYMGSVNEWKIKDSMTWRGQNLHAEYVRHDKKWKYQYTLYDT